MTEHESVRVRRTPRLLHHVRNIFVNTFLYSWRNRRRLVHLYLQSAVSYLAVCNLEQTTTNHCWYLSSLLEYPFKMQTKFNIHVTGWGEKLAYPGLRETPRPVSGERRPSAVSSSGWRRPPVPQGPQPPPSRVRRPTNYYCSCVNLRPHLDQKNEVSGDGRQ